MIVYPFAYSNVFVFTATLLWVGEHRCLNVGWKYCFKKNRKLHSELLSAPCCASFSIEMLTKRKDNCVVHLLAWARECVTPHSSWMPSVGFEFLWVNLHISDRRHQGLAASVGKRINRETGLLTTQFSSLSPLTANESH